MPGINNMPKKCLVQNRHMPGICQLQRPGVPNNPDFKELKTLAQIGKLYHCCFVLSADKTKAGLLFDGAPKIYWCGKLQEEKDELQNVLHQAVQAIFEHNHAKKQTAKQKSQHYMDPEIAELSLSFMERPPTWQDWPQRLWALRTRERFIPLPIYGKGSKGKRQGNAKGRLPDGSPASDLRDTSPSGPPLPITVTSPGAPPGTSQGTQMVPGARRENTRQEAQVQALKKGICPVCQKPYQELQAHILEVCPAGNQQRLEWQKHLLTTVTASINHKVVDLFERSQAHQMVQSILPANMHLDADWCNNMPLISTLGTISHSLKCCLEPLDLGIQKSIVQDMQRIIAIKGEAMIYAFQKRTGAFHSTSLSSL